MKQSIVYRYKFVFVSLILLAFAFNNCSKYQSTAELSSLGAVTNQSEELEYFDAYLLPLSEKQNLQAALDTHGAVRLELGNYSGVNVILRSHQRLYGHPAFSQVSGLTIAAGSTGVVLKDLFFWDEPITFEAGAPITNCMIKTIKYVLIQSQNAQVENCTMINVRGLIRIDNNSSGYFRNNKIIKHQAGSHSNLLVLKGNSTTPSYGNTFLHSNYLTPHGDTTDINNIQSLTMVGIDAEGWNLASKGTKAMFTAKNMGRLNLTDVNGGGFYSANQTPTYDIDATNLFFLNKAVNLPTDVLSPRTNVFIADGTGTHTRSPGTVTGFEILTNIDYPTHLFKYNGVQQTSTLSNTTDVSLINKIKTMLLDDEHKPWARPTWETLPDPLGPNWKANRVGKTDQTSYIQNLINKNKIAELTEGIFYIRSTLFIPLDWEHGIIGRGTGKTVIVGMTDDFPLISLTGGQDANIHLAYLTLQGGNAGIYSSQDYGTQHIAFQQMKFIIFRDQNYGIHLKQMMGFDNNFLDNLSFVNNNIGFFQDPRQPHTHADSSSFVDKTMFYKNQFLNCGTAVSMIATRADNLNGWVDSKFDGGNIALNLHGQIGPIVANSEFTHYRGPYVIHSNSISIYNAHVHNNMVTGTTIAAIDVTIEGSKFLDKNPLFFPIAWGEPELHIYNSTIAGNVETYIEPGSPFKRESGLYSNSLLLSNPNLSKLLVHVKDGVPLVIVDSVPKPYPQLLVTQ